MLQDVVAFPRAKVEENSFLRNRKSPKTKIYDRVFVRNRGYCVNYPSIILQRTFSFECSMVRLYEKQIFPSFVATT